MFYDSVARILSKAHIFARNDPLQAIGLAPGRPLLMLTFYLNYVAGGMDPFLYRLANAIFLAMSGLALTMLATVVFETPGLRVRGTTRQKRLAAIFLGFLFVVHPLQSFVVLYVWQRAAIMSCFFYLASMALYVALRSGRLQQPIPVYILVQILFLGAILSKENAATLPFALLLVEITLFRLNIRELAKRIGIIVLITLPPLILYMLALRFFHGAESPTPPGVITRLITYYQVSGMSPLQVFMTECRVLFSYLSMVVLPFIIGVQLVKVEIISTSFWNPPWTPFAVVGFVGLLILGLATLRRIPILAFGILFYLGTLAPEALLMPKYLFVGYRPILPMVGVIIVLVWSAVEAVSWSEVRPGRVGFKFAVFIVGAFALISFSTQTLVQARNWSPLQIWKEAYRRLPSFSKQVEVAAYLDTLLSYSALLTASEEYEKALSVLGKAGLERSVINGVPAKSVPGSEFDIVIRRNPKKAAQAIIHMGVALDNSGDREGAVSAYKWATKINPRSGIAWYNLGCMFDQSDSLPEAVNYYQNALKVAPESAKVWYNLGLTLKRMGKLPQAILHLEKAVKVDPRNGMAYNSLGTAWEESGNLARALANYEKAWELMPNNLRVNYNFGNALMKNGNLDEAVRKYRKALEIDPGFSRANANLGVALLRSGKFGEAIISLRKALSVDAKNAELHNALGVAYAELGQESDAIEQFREALAIEPDHQGAAQNLRNVLGNRQGNSVQPESALQTQSEEE
jgi:protein O-mannosyl-transferase